MRAILRAHPAGFSDRCRRNAMGTQKSQSSALLRAEAKLGKAKVLRAVALDRLVIFGSPFAAARAGRKRP